MWLQASAFQMSVLLQYNNGDSFTVVELQQNTQMSMVFYYLRQGDYFFSLALVTILRFYCTTQNKKKEK